MKSNKHKAIVVAIVIALVAGAIIYKNVIQEKDSANNANRKTVNEPDKKKNLPTMLYFGRFT